MYVIGIGGYIVVQAVHCHQSTDDRITVSMDIGNAAFYGTLMLSMNRQAASELADSIIKCLHGAAT